MAGTIYFGKDYHVTEARCPSCNKRLDGATKTGSKPGEGAPDPGDFSVCIYCATILRFEIGGQLRRASSEDLHEFLTQQPDEFAVLQKVAVAARACIRERIRKNYRGN